MPIHQVLIYSNVNIGVFSRADDKVMLLPRGYSKPKSKRLASMLGVEPHQISIADTRLIGPLVAMNRHGVLITRFAREDEVNELRRVFRERVVERFASKHTAVGNLVLANDRGALVSSLLSAAEISQIRDVLGVDTVKSSIAGYHQVGAVGVANNKGALLHPMATDDELDIVRDVLKAEEVERGTVNSGVPFVSSGLVVNNNSALVGSMTTGPELFIISKVFKIE